MKKLVYDKDRLTEARDLRTRWYKGEEMPRIPYVFTVDGYEPLYNPREMCEDGKKAAECFIHSFQNQFDTFPDSDFLPVMNYAYLGQGLLPSMYGAKQVLDEFVPPFTEGRIYKDIYEAEAVANDFEIEDTEWGKKLKEHMEIFIEATNGEIPVCIADYQSPYGSATKLLPNEELMMAMYDEPELVHKLLNTVTDGIIKLIDTMEKWAGEELFAYNMYNPLPGLDGLCIWDDYISVITPSLHQEFCRPYNLKLFERYGHGHLHTCGPYFPNFIDSVLACKPRTLDMIILRGMGKSREDMLKLLEIAKKNDILLTCPLDYNDVSFFDPNPQRVDDTFLYKFMEGGYMPSATGTYEYGLEFAKKVRAFK